MMLPTHVIGLRTRIEIAVGIEECRLTAGKPMSGVIPMSIETAKFARLVVTYRPVDTLVPDARNARTHPKRQLDQIASSIRQFGFTNPILIDPDGRIIAGHGRLLAAKALGLSEVPTIALEGLSEGQKRALRIADNKIALGAGWDIDLLRVELSELSIDLDLSITGFSTGELDVMLNERSDPDDEVIPAIPLQPRTQSRRHLDCRPPPHRLR